MLFKKLTCLLLALVFIASLAVPTALADDTPPGGGDIHPWDNNDDYRYGGGPIFTSDRPPVLFFGFGLNGRMFVLSFSALKQWMNSRVDSSQRALRIQTELPTLNSRTSDR